MRVAIIGGGISGIAFANVFRRFGHEAVVFEKTGSVGGVWAASYPGVRLQNSREQYHLIDLAWPVKLDQHPTVKQIINYMGAAVARFGIDMRVRHEVIALEERPQGWTVSVRADGKTTNDDFDYVIVSIGQYTEGKHRPSFDGEGNFSGTLVTEREVKSLEIFDRQRVVVVGRSGPQILDSRLSEILVPVQAARSSAAGSKYTTSGVRRSSARCRRLAL